MDTSSTVGKKILSIYAPSLAEHLEADSCQITEGISELFQVDIKVRTNQPTRVGELIGRQIALQLQVSASQGVRWFNGIATAVRSLEALNGSDHACTIQIRPQLWLLSQRSNCRIWQNTSSKDIIEAMFEEHQFARPLFNLLEQQLPKKEYSVQWNETDLNYLLRRVEEDGLFFWFTHSEDKHTSCFSDSAMGWGPHDRTIEKFVLNNGSFSNSSIDQWNTSYEIRSTQVSLADWNFQQPSIIPTTKVPSVIGINGSGVREIYVYPARALAREELEFRGKVHMRSHESDYMQVNGKSNIRVLHIGHRFSVRNALDSSIEAVEWVPTRLVHNIVESGSRNESHASSYSNDFLAIQAATKFTPRLVTSRPVIAGTQIAIVAGPENEQIFTDEYGRIKLWFPWDRSARRDGSDTCWVRVAQNWAGGQWGGQIIPRVGMEVLVSFIDGDPDRPVVLGAVPNSQNMTPYELPKHKTKSVFRTTTFGMSGFNELSFEDRAGHQEIFIHAHKDKLEMVNMLSSEIVGPTNDELRLKLAEIVNLSSSWEPGIQTAAKDLLKQAEQIDGEKQKKRS